MNVENVVNITYSAVNENSVDIMFNDGAIIEYSFEQLELPYFYSGADLKRVENVPDNLKEHIVSCEKVVKKALRDEGLTDALFYKVVTDSPKYVSRLRYLSPYSAEGNIPYIVRRLGADGVLTFSNELKNYAYIDIEEQNGQITLIGEIDIVDKKKYYAFFNVKDFLQHLEEAHITAIIAWNGNGYDFLRIEKGLIEESNNVLKRRWQNILKIDAMQFYSKYMATKLMTLNAAAKEQEVGEKLELSKDFDKVSMEELITYNRQDVQIMMDLMEKTAVIQIAMSISNLTGIIPTELSPTRIADNLMIRRYKKDEMVLFDYEGRPTRDIRGAEVIAPHGGVHMKVGSFDINGMYPEIMLRYKWEGLGATIYNIISGFTAEFKEERKKLKQLYAETAEEKYEVRQKAMKVLQNSLYGIFSNQFYRYSNPNIGEFITSTGRSIRKKLQSIAEEMGYTVIISDTDSIFVENIDKGVAENLVEIINRRMAPFEVKLEKYYTKMIVFLSAGGEAAKKRYVGLTEKGELEVTGIELKRSDVPELTKVIEETIFDMVLKEGKGEENVKEYLANIRGRLTLLPIELFLFDRVVDVDKSYKSKTRIVKVAEMAGYKLAINTEDFTNKAGVTRERKIYKVLPKGEEKLFEVMWVMGKKNEPIVIESGKNLESYREVIDFESYWKTNVVMPVNRLLASIGYETLPNE
ncbi:MAG: DNA polymerase domain-containing protein, partial [Candidatus Parvarchaeum sp.]